MLKYEKIFDNFDLKKFETSVLSGKGHDWNAAYECCDRWVNSNKTALNWISSKGKLEQLSYRDLEVKSKNFANILIKKGSENSLFLIIKYPPQIIKLRNIKNAKTPKA